ncbi:MAG: tetratricopeptide repeat protein [Alphaproteobacteria bacterium]|nr:tetratricopeptide repeat protein [Alphaproteobacteria bacterium]
MTLKFSSSFLSFMLLGFCALLLTACGAQNEDDELNTSLPPAQTHSTGPTSSRDVLYGSIKDNLDSIESNYAANPSDPLIAARYAKALREDGQIKKAKTILMPLANNPKIATLAQNELAIIYLKEGSYGSSEQAARAAIKADNGNYRAWRNLGNALDAQEKYPEGESAFRKSLALWGDDDKIAPMNNLALNLAAQGKNKEALDMLYEARKIAPNQTDIERNIRIIQTLNEPAQFQGQKKPFPPNDANGL